MRAYLFDTLQLSLSYLPRDYIFILKAFNFAGRPEWFCFYVWYVGVEHADSAGASKMFSPLGAQEEETEMDNSKQGVQDRTEGKVWHLCGREK